MTSSNDMEMEDDLFQPGSDFDFANIVNYNFSQADLPTETFVCNPCDSSSFFTYDDGSQVCLVYGNTVFTGPSAYDLPGLPPYEAGPGNYFITCGHCQNHTEVNYCISGVCMACTEAAPPARFDDFVPDDSFGQLDSFVPMNDFAPFDSFTPGDGFTHAGGFAAIDGFVPGDFAPFNSIAPVDGFITQESLFCDICGYLKPIQGMTYGTCFDCVQYFDSPLFPTDEATALSQSNDHEHIKVPQPNTSKRSFSETKDDRNADGEIMEDGSNADHDKPNFDNSAARYKRVRLEDNESTPARATFVQNRNPMYPNNDCWPLRDRNPGQAAKLAIAWVKRSARSISSCAKTMKAIVDEGEDDDGVSSRMNAYLTNQKTSDELTAISHRLHQINDYGTQGLFAQWDTKKISKPMVQDFKTQYERMTDDINTMTSYSDEFAEFDDIMDAIERFGWYTSKIAAVPSLTDAETVCGKRAPDSEFE